MGNNRANSAVKNEILDLFSFINKADKEDYEDFFTVNDDIWQNNTLIIKSGSYLTEGIVKKLLNFGIYKINVSQKTKEKQENIDVSIEYKRLMESFKNTRSCLIVDENVFDAGIIINKLSEIGLNTRNIFFSKDIWQINSYFRAKQINFLFVSASLYSKCQKCVEKYSFLKNTHVFILHKEAFSAKGLSEKGKNQIYHIEIPSLDGNINSEVINALKSNFSSYAAEFSDFSKDKPLARKFGFAKTV